MYKNSFKNIFSKVLSVWNSQVFKRYDGSTAHWSGPLVHGFLLYKQPGPIVSNEVSLYFNLSNFVHKHRLDGKWDFFT